MQVASRRAQSSDVVDEDVAAQLVELKAENAALKQQLDWFKRQLFGRKSEKRLIENPDQLGLAEMIQSLQAEKITLFAQDWGGLLGLRVLADRPELFSAVVVANTGLPTGDHPVSDAFLQWQDFAREAPQFPIGAIVARMCTTRLDPIVSAAYDAPFPDEAYKAGARAFPQLVPTRRDDPAADANRNAWRVLAGFEQPLITAFSDGDPITRGGDKLFQEIVPGAKGQPHTIIHGAGHFLQEDQGPAIARMLGTAGRAHAALMVEGRIRLSANARSSGMDGFR